MTDGNIYAINKHLDGREGYGEPKAASWKNREIELDGATYVLKLKGEAYAAEMEARLAKAMQVVEMIASADVDAVLGEAVDLSCEIIGDLMEGEQ